MQEIQNLAVAKQAKDAEVIDLVHQLEGLTAEVCATREQRTALTTEAKEISRKNEQVVVQINSVKEQVREQEQMFLLR